MPRGAARRVSLEKRFEIIWTPRRRWRAIKSAERPPVLIEEIVWIAQAVAAARVARAVEAVSATVDAVETHQALFGVSRVDEEAAAVPKRERDRLP